MTKILFVTLKLFVGIWSYKSLVITFIL